MQRTFTFRTRLHESATRSEEEFVTTLTVCCGRTARCIRVLKNFIKKDVKYQGIDYKDSNEVVGHNLENGIPFDDKSFDIVFALDVLEHVENIHFLFDEIIRVSKDEAIIALPNMSYWKFRLRFLKGKDISKKYIFLVLNSK